MILQRSRFSSFFFAPSWVLFGLALLAAVPAWAGQKDHCHDPVEAAAIEEAREGAVRMDMPDLELVDQDGNPVNFARDVIGDRVVAMNFIFTTCTTICPPMGAHFAKLQKMLAEQGRDDVLLVSVSIDPERDTPERLKAWRDRFGGGEGWTLVTGPKPRMDVLLKQLKVFSPDAQDHAAQAMVGSGEEGMWRRLYGLTAPVEIADLLRGFETPREAATEKEAGR